ncbi:MAG: ABC transporter ATP-binding protein [Prevotellaceae bacterium]|jgi:ABC-type multidrug transport system ATPase subunit|nr:ABC transporter ATP-binding protein [Prevotellaceae bacterium]
MKAIQVNNICLNYGKLAILKEISFEVERGEIFGLIGADGAGKTSLFRILTTLLLADSGSAMVEGFDVVCDYKQIRKHVGYMPERFSLYQDLTVEENLNFFASVFNTSVKENYYLIEDIYRQIEPFKNRRAGQLSGGMKQKLALSCALIHKPSVLFLDEPTTGVDPVSRKEFWGMLKKLKQQGIAILVSTPYMDEVSMCDRIAFIQRGKILTVNMPQKIIADFPHKIYSVESNNSYEILKQLRRNSAVRSVFSFGDTLHVIFNSKSEIQNEKNNIQFKEISPTVEDCFMILMEESN